MKKQAIKKKIEADKEASAMQPNTDFKVQSVQCYGLKSDGFVLAV